MAFAPMIIPALIGFFFCSLLLSGVPIPRKGTLCALLSPVTGLGITSLLVFAARLFDFPAAAKSGFYASTLLMMILLFLFFHSLARYPQEKKPRQKKERIPFLKAAAHWLLFLALLYFLFIFFQHFFGLVSNNPEGGWDARYLWQLKARFLYRDPARWEKLFSPLVGWKNHDYPLMFPCSIVWGWEWWGYEAMSWPVVISLSLLLSLAGLVTWYLSLSQKPAAGFIAGMFLLSIPAYSFWSAALYADVPFSLLTTASVLMMILGFKVENEKCFTLAGFLAGLAAWLKNEGLLLLLVLLFIFIVSFLTHARRSKIHPFRALLFFVSGAAVPVTAALIVKMLGGNAYFFEKKSLSDYMNYFTDLKKIKTIAVGFTVFMARFQQWHALWVLFAATLAAWLSSKRFRTPGTGFLLAAIVLLETGYFFIYIISPVDILFHMQTSLIRVLLHTAGLALIFTFDTLGKPITPAGTKESS